MNKKQKQFSDQIFDQGLSRIRQRLTDFTSTGLSQLQSTNTFRLGMTDLPQSRTSGFSGKMQSLDKQCKLLQQQINDLNAKQRNILTRFNLMKEDLLTQINKIQKSTDLAVSELSGVVKSGIEQSTQRRKIIQQNYYKNIQASNATKISIVELKNKINEIEHRLGCNATIWQKL